MFRFKATLRAGPIDRWINQSSGMESGGHYVTDARYTADQIDAVFVGHSCKRHGVVGDAFVDAPLSQSLKSLVPGKRFLDIGCGVGDSSGVTLPLNMGQKLSTGLIFRKRWWS